VRPRHRLRPVTSSLLRPEQLPRRPNLAALDVAHVHHRVTDGRVGARKPGVDDQVAHGLRAGRQPTGRKRNAARIALPEAAIPIGEAASGLSLHQ
jgi:hypothetical protein